MIIKIINVGEPQAVKKYFTLEVNYKDENGKVAGKKLMSFNYPLVFNTCKTLQSGDTVDVKTQKNDAGYWDWIEVKKVDGDAASTPPSKTEKFASSASSGDRYETKEERLARQKYIIRQSSLSTAVETLAVGSKGVDPDKVVELARKYEAYVFETNPIQELMDMSDDLPE